MDLVKAIRNAGGDVAALEQQLSITLPDIVYAAMVKLVA